MRRKARPIALWLLLLTTSGCQSVKVAYYFLDDMIDKQVDPYLLDSASKRLAARQIDGFKLWLKRGVMPGAATALERIAHPIAHGKLDRAEFSRWYATLGPLWARTARRLSQDVALVLSQHCSPAQLAHMRRAMIKRDGERLEKLRRPRDARLRERTKSTVKAFERFSGSFDKRQWRLVWMQHEPLLEDWTHWLRNRQLRRRALFARLARRPGRAELARFLARMIQRPEDFSEPGYAAHSRRRVAGFRGLVYAVVSSMTVKQRTTLAVRLVSLAKQLRSLAAS